MLEIFKIAFMELYANKGRTILTSLGIAIGVLSVTLIIASGGLANQFLISTLTSQIGDTKAVQVNPFEPGKRDATTIITNQDLIFVRRLGPSLGFDNPVPVTSYGTLMRDFEDKSVSQDYTGTTPDYFPKYKKLDGLTGRFFDDNDNKNSSNVVVLSRDYVKNRLGKSSVLDENITIQKEKFLVIGEYDEKSSFGAPAERGFMPINTVWRLGNNNRRTLNTFSVIVDDESKIKYVTSEIESRLNNYRASSFSGLQAKPAGVQSAQASIDTVNSVLNAFQTFLALVAIISLVVGGIGVLNVMLMSVSQRVKEIGIRKAFGAKNTDILALFLSESVTLTSLSGLFGALTAQYLVYVGVRLVNNLNSLNLIADYNWYSVYIAFLLSAIIGVGFGIYPAYKAGQMSVVDALRYD